MQPEFTIKVFNFIEIAISLLNEEDTQSITKRGIKMARISYRDRDDVPTQLQHLFDDMSTYGPFGSLVGAMAHRPPIFEHVFDVKATYPQSGAASPPPLP